MWRQNYTLYDKYYASPNSEVYRRFYSRNDRPTSVCRPSAWDSRHVAFSVATRSDLKRVTAGGFVSRRVVVASGARNGRAFDFLGTLSFNLFGKEAPVCLPSIAVR